MVLIKKIFVFDIFYEEGVIFILKYDKVIFDIFLLDVMGLGLDICIYSWIFVECFYINLMYFRSRKCSFVIFWCKDDFFFMESVKDKYFFD